MTDTLKSVIEEELQKAYERGVQDGMKREHAMWQLTAIGHEIERKWVGLTDEEKKAIYEQADTENWHDQPLLEAVEAKLKEKNE